MKTHCYHQIPKADSSTNEWSGINMKTLAEPQISNPYLRGGGQDNLRWLINSPSSAPWFSAASRLLQLPAIESSELEVPSLHWGGVEYFEPSPDELLGVMRGEECWPTRSRWRVENESLMADVASKNRVHEASAAGIGRNISYIQVDGIFSVSALINVFEDWRWENNMICRYNFIRHKFIFGVNWSTRSKELIL